MALAIVIGQKEGVMQKASLYYTVVPLTVHLALHRTVFFVFLNLKVNGLSIQRYTVKHTYMHIIQIITLLGFLYGKKRGKWVCLCTYQLYPPISPNPVRVGSTRRLDLIICIISHPQDRFQLQISQVPHTQQIEIVCT